MKCLNYRLLVATVATLVMGIVGMESARALDIGPMTWTPKSDWVNVKNPSAFPGMAGFTAATGNGTTDDTAALQAILTYIQNHYDYPRTVYFPPGTYKITSTLTIAYVTNLSFIGCGSSTIISWAGPTGGAMYAPNGSDGMRYIGLTWEGNNTAACAYEEDSQGWYAGGLRHENESFHDINAPATYAYLTDTTGDTSTTPTPPTGAIVSGYAGSLTGETQIWNCRFYNCTSGTSESWVSGNYFCWFYDSCEFDNCGTAINMLNSGGNVITNCHFQGSTTADILGGGDNHIRHCTSVGSAFFFSDFPGSFTDYNVLEDCWVDSWTHAGYAMLFQVSGPNTIFDCTFTNPPAGANSPIDAYTGNFLNHLLLSNNYASGLSAGTPLVNTNSQPSLVENVPPGLRFGALTLKSASQTFLKTAYPADSTHIIDISQAPYVSQWTYPNQNGFGGQGLPDITVALQAAVTAAKTANNGSIVYIPSGIYNLSATINASGSNYTIEGNGFSTELCWWGPNNASMISITAPQNLAVKNIYLTVQDGETVAGVGATSTAATTLTFDDISYATFQVNNPAASAWSVDGPGLALSNLPSGSTVYAPLLDIPITVQNCGAAQILVKYLAGGGTTAVSGTTAPTGFLGAMFSEGGNVIAGDYDINVTDNQSLILGSFYVESDVSSLSLSAGSRTGKGQVSIGSFNTGSGNPDGASGSQYLVNVNNYAGRLFYVGGRSSNWYDLYPTSVNQTGANPIDMIFAATTPNYGYTFTLGSGANLISTLNVEGETSPIVDIADSPATITPADYLSIAQAFDHFRLLEAIQLSVQDGLTTDGPAIAQYPFEGNVLDMTGNYNGTASNVTYVPGLGSQAASFNGTSSYVQINNPISTNFSIAMWINTTDTGGTGQWYAGHGLVDGYTAVNAADFGTALNGGKFSFGVGNTDKTLTSTVAVNDGSWHHVVATRNSSTGAMQVYVDGVLNNSVTGPTGTKNAATVLRIGDLKTGGSGTFFKGTLDQVQIYNYVLSATDVGVLYNRTVSSMPQPSGLAGYWKLDESSGTTSYDSSGNNITGTQVNGPSFTTDHASTIAFRDAGSLAFNGSSQCVTMNMASQKLPSGLAPRTICGWAKSNGASSNALIFSYGSPGTGQGMWLGTGSDGTSLDAGGFTTDLPPVPGFWDGNWHFVALTYDGTTARLYGDGVLKESVAESWSLVPAFCSIGSLYGVIDYWNGSLDEIRVYNRALTQTEVSALTAGTGPSGLAGYWKLDETGSTTTYDSSGNNINGTQINGPTFTTDHPPVMPFSDPGSMALNGSNQCVTMSTSSPLPSGTTPRSICGWAKSNGASFYTSIFSYGSAGTGQGMWLGTGPDGTSLDAGGYTTDLPPVPGFWDGNWHFIALTYDGTTARLYGDGVLKESVAESWSLVPDYCSVGSLYGYDDYWNGSLDDIRVYNRALSATEIFGIAAGTAPSTSGLAGYWKLDENCGTNSYDSSGDDIDGPWINGPTPTTDHPAAMTFNDPGALAFNGTNQCVTMTPLSQQLPSGTSPRTICGWAKSSGASFYSLIFSYGSPGTGQGMWLGTGADGTSLDAGGYTTDLPPVPGFWDGNWHFVALTYDGTTARLYGDGVLKESVAESWSLVPGYCSVGSLFSYTDYWKGSLDDIRVYKRALSATEISNLAAGNSSP